MEKIIYIYPSLSTFVLKDIKILEKKYKVITFKQNWGNKKLIFINLIVQFFLLFKELPQSNSILIMFGGYWSFFPCLLGKLFKKPVFIILGGTDCVSFPELNYGSLRKPILRIVIKWSYKLSTRLLPVSETLVLSDYTYMPNTTFKKQGFLNFFPNLSTPYSVIYNGFYQEVLKADNVSKNKNSFITIGNFTDNTRIVLKGVDIIFKIAPLLENCHFTIVGFSRELLIKLKKEYVNDNITILGFLPSNEIIKILEKSEFYMQLSISEGFPNALCEAMMHKCIPIGSNVGAIPKIINDTGFIMRQRKFEDILTSIKEIIKLHKIKKVELGERAALRIQKEFNIEKREQALLNILESAGKE